MNWFDGLLNVGEFTWRDGVLIAIVLLTIYFVVTVLRFSQLRRPPSEHYGNDESAWPAIKTPTPEWDAPPGSALAGIWQLPPEPSITTPLTDPAPFRNARENARDTRSKKADKDAPDFAKHLAYASLEGEMNQLQAQLIEARTEISRLRDEVSQLQAAQSVSPLYNEAMSMAVRGVDAAGVAGRCGISIAEAELVVALSRKPDTPAQPRERVVAEKNSYLGEDSYGRS